MKDKFQYMFITLKKLHLGVSLLYWKSTVKKKSNKNCAESGLPSLYSSVFAAPWLVLVWRTSPGRVLFYLATLQYFSCLSLIQGLINLRSIRHLSRLGLHAWLQASLHVSARLQPDTLLSRLSPLCNKTTEETTQELKWGTRTRSSKPGNPPQSSAK